MNAFDPADLGLACKARGARQTVDAIRDGDLTARQALEDCIAMLDARNGAINAVVSTDLDGARTRADAIDRQMAAGTVPGALAGLPVTIKEVFDVEGFPTSWGDPKLAANMPARDSGVARELKNAGAVIFGKTNIPERMSDWETDNTQWGPTRNPWDHSLSAGGSSGGSAAAVAAGITSACVGSDMGGSIRMPAHYCGVYALKPTWNLISMTGHSLNGEMRSPDISVAGPFARKAEDLALLLTVLAQPEPLERDGWRVQLPEARPKPLSELHIGCLLDHPDCPIDAPYGEAMTGFIERLRQSDVTIATTARPDFDFTRATDIMNLLARAETATMMSDEAYEEAHLATDAPGHRGQNARGNTLSHRDWLQLHEERITYRQRWSEYFEQYDAFLCPVAASCAPPLISGITSVLERTIDVNGRPIDMTDQHFWAGIASLAYLPAVALPVGFTNAGLPAGMQLVGPAYGDLALIAMAEALVAAGAE
jgi:amidase